MGALKSALTFQMCSSCLNGPSRQGNTLLLLQVLLRSGGCSRGGADRDAVDIIILYCFESRAFITLRAFDGSVFEKVTSGGW